MDWNFIKVFLAIFRHGSAVKAAPQLGMSESTLFRHLSTYEQEMGQIFIRHSRTNYTLTKLGESILATALDIEGLYQKVSREVSKRDDLKSAQVTLTAPTSFSYFLMPRVINALAQREPDIRVNLRVTNDSLSLNTHQADIALRVTSKPPNNYIGRKVASIGWSAFCGPNHTFKEKPPQCLEDLLKTRVIGASGELLALPAYEWIEKNCADVCATFTDDFVAMSHLAESHQGIAILPDEFSLHPLRRLFPISAFSENSLWVLKHRDARQVKRVGIVEKLLVKTLTEAFKP
ncbi:LysR family transcriptional regulator [Gilvimarinus algae]|uniref:LysR family transcriptional regulator n=1 Tax=Gilvimarinus algae TaxID=3058037 RepID=A0ABT8TBY9_9GAMM|nr:LysR family transcriptional regulator [Gilvimarinus sp. SDUM040014]MDO3381617.1 LysR family transcriptional regulator [Gilvimarinus sp. SDUM040014]